MSAEVADPPQGRTAEVLDDEALAFVGRLHERFEPRRQELLAARRERRARIAAGETGALVDAGLFLYHNTRRLLDQGSGPTSPKRACATTSTSASSTSPRGCAATAPRGSTG
ncbi:MAG: Malate synthase [Solirubrobacteraceae bacterium]|jgi:malate synthase|nr:Malate synthase [Solirubrobacteraceae bacterium]